MSALSVSTWLPRHRSRRLLAVLIAIVLLVGFAGVAVLTQLQMARFDQAHPSVPPVAAVNPTVVKQFSPVAAPGVPAYLAIGADGSLLVGNRSGPSVDRYGPDGQLLSSWGPRLGSDITLGGIAGVATSGADTFVLDPEQQRVFRIDGSGAVTAQISFSGAGTYGPGALAVDTAEHIYIADTGGNRILVYDVDGQLLKTIGSGGNGNGQLRQPMGISIAPNGALYVAELENRRISWWDAAGNFGGNWATAFAPWSVSVDAPGRVFVPDADAHTVHVYGPGGDQLAQLPEGSSPLDFPSEAGLTPDGTTLWVLGHNGLVEMELQPLPQPVSGGPAPNVFMPALGTSVAILGGFAILALAGVGVWRVGASAARGLAPLVQVPADVAGAVCIIVALPLAIGGQAQVALNNSIAQARPMHILALGLAGLGSLLLGRDVIAIPRVMCPGLALHWPRARARAVIGIGALLMLSALPLTVLSAFEAARFLWLLGVASMVIAAVATNGIGVPSLNRHQLLVLSAVIGIVIAAFALRFFDLASLPPEVHGDEAAVGLQARKLMSGQVLNLFGTGWYQLPMLGFALQVPSMWLLGNDLFGLRMGSVLEGTLSVLVTFLLARRLFNTRVGLVAAGLLAGAEMHIHYSRIGNTYIQAALATALVLYLMLRAVETGRIADYILLGLAGGLSLVVYAAARLVLALVALYVIHTAVRDRSFLARHIAGLTVAALAGLVFLSPLLVTYVHDPGSLNVRMNEISIFSDQGSRHEFGTYGTTSYPEVIAHQTQHTLEAFNYTGETSQQYAHPAPLLDFWTGALLVLGVGAFAFRFGNPTYFLLATWLWLTLLLGAILTVDAPFSPHLAGMLPLLAIYPALAFELIWRIAQRAQGAIALPIMAAAAVTLVAVAGYANLHDYLDVHVVKLQPAGMYTEMSHYIQRVEPEYQVYFISRRDVSLDYDTINFLVPDSNGISLRDGPLTLQPPAPGKGMAFIVDPGLSDASQRLQQLQQMFPSGREQQHRSTLGTLLFTTYEVDG